VGGPGFVRSVLGPTPWTRVMPTGGVEATQASIAAWFKAGVAAVGIGSDLIRKEWVQAGDYSAITAKTVEVIGWIQGVRGDNVFRGVEHPGLYPHGGAGAREIAEWYGTTFGFKVTEGNSSFFVAGPEPGRIEVMKQGDTDRCHLAIQVTDFEAAVAALQARGLEVEQPVIRADLKAAYLKQTDPAGNRIHLLWRR